MASINPVNVLLLLLEHYKPRFPSDSPVNGDELLLKQRLQDTIDPMIGLTDSLFRGIPKKAVQQELTTSSDEAIIIKFQPAEHIEAESEADVVEEEDANESDARAYDEEMPEDQDEQGSTLDEADLMLQKRLEGEGAPVEEDPTYPDSEAEEKLAKPSSSTKFASLDYKRRAVAYWRGTATRKRRKFSSVNNMFRLARSEHTLRDWEKQLQEGGSRLDKLKMLFDKTVELVRAAKERGEAIPDAAIKKYALQANEEVQLKDFVAGAVWVNQFRKDCPDGLGTRMTRLKEVEQRLIIKCRDEMKEGRILSDKEIKQYALEINAVVKETTFKASHTWVMWFRQRHGIKSRIASRKPNSTRNGVPITPKTEATKATK